MESKAQLTKDGSNGKINACTEDVRAMYVWWENRIANEEHMKNEIEIIQIKIPNNDNFDEIVDFIKFIDTQFDKLDLYRVKGFYGSNIINWAFGRTTITNYKPLETEAKINLTLMGTSLEGYIPKLKEFFKITTNSDFLKYIN